MLTNLTPPPKILTQEIIDKILEHRNNKTIAMFKGFSHNVPSWSDFIQYLEESSYERPEEGSSGYLKGRVMSRDPFYFYTEAHRTLGDGARDIEDAISNTFNSKGGMEGTFITFSSNAINAIEHSDFGDNFYWQCIGSTNWTWGNQSYLVEPGDFLYIPQDVKHSVEFTMPRASIAFRWNFDQSPLVSSYTVQK